MEDSVGNRLVSLPHAMSNMTNLIGLIEKNINSYDRLKDRNKRKRLHKNLTSILENLISWRTLCHETIWHIAQEITHSDKELSDELAVKLLEDMNDLSSDIYDPSNDFICQFNAILQQTSDLLVEFKDDLLTIDYRIFENIEDHIEARLLILDFLKEARSKRVSKDTLLELFEKYRKMVRSLASCKDTIQHHMSNVG